MLGYVGDYGSYLVDCLFGVGYDLGLLCVVSKDKAAYAWIE